MNRVYIAGPGNHQGFYSDCPQMLSTFQGEKIKWDDIALHVFAYDQACK